MISTTHQRKICVWLMCAASQGETACQWASRLISRARVDECQACRTALGDRNEALQEELDSRISCAPAPVGGVDVSLWRVREDRPRRERRGQVELRELRDQSQAHARGDEMVEGAMIIR